MNNFQNLSDNLRFAATLRPTINLLSALHSPAKMLGAALPATFSASRQQTQQCVNIQPLHRRTTHVSNQLVGDWKSPQTTENKQPRSILSNHFPP
jgi:hypothetical protein